MIVLKSFRLDDCGAGDVVTRWYAQYDDRPKVRAKLDSRMTYLRQQNREGWIREPYDTLRDDIGEVRFKADQMWYRPLGYFGPGRNEFTFLFFATKTDEFDPPNAIDIAVERKLVVENNPKRAIRLRRWGQI
jgi:hypothetical protein